MIRYKQKIIVIFLLVITLSYNPTLFLAQTLDELEQEIEQIKEETERQKAEKEKIKVEKANTEADIADIQVEIEEINANIAAEQAKIDDKNFEIEVQKGKIKEIQDKIPEAKAEAGTMLAAMQKMENSDILVQIVLAPSDGEENNILRRLESVNSISEFAGGVVVDLIDLEAELLFEKTVLDKQKAELEQNQLALETEQKNLETKEAEYQALLSSQSESIDNIDANVGKAAEDQAMMEDTLSYYQSLGCSGADVVGSKCGGLADDDGDGIQNNQDSCPNEYGNQSNGCPAPTTGGGGTSGGGNAGGGGNTGGGGSSGTSFIRPLANGVVTCEYACYSGHIGIDLDYADYVPILATAPGVVTTSRGGCAPFVDGVNGCNGGYGNYVMVTHNTSSGTYFSLYAHMAGLSVVQGQTVSQGQQLGTLGDSGNSAGSHLHFEFFKDTNGNGVPDEYRTNPRNYISFPNTGAWW